MALDVTGRFRYPQTRPAWLSLHEEEILDPGQRIVDAHHHLWTEAGQPYLMDDLLLDLASGHRILATVYAQGHFSYRTDGPPHLRPIGETVEVERMRRAALARGVTCRPCAGFIGFADLFQPDLIDEVLDAHAAAAPDTFRGIRHSAARDSHFPDGVVLRPAPAGMLGDARVLASLARVAARGYRFDAMVYQEQVPEVTALARAMPSLPIVLDHYACPLGVGHYEGRAAEVLAVLARDVVDLADCPNVVAKLGGLGMIVTGARWHLAERPPDSATLARAWRPYFDAFIGPFGAERCMFESNFPVDKAMYSYPVVWNAFKRLASGASAEERDFLFHGTATRVYALHVGD